MKNILHISDLHLSTKEGRGFFYQKVEDLLELISVDLNENHDEPIDAVFLTGDITFSGEQEEFDKVKDVFILPLLEILSLDVNSLFFVPGNHDVTRSKVSPIDKNFRETANGSLIDNVSELVNLRKQEWPRLDNFIKFKSDILAKCSNITYDADLITVRSVGKAILVHCLNSAWLAGDDHDKGNLRISNQLKYSLDKYGRGKSNIVLIHHPTDWFHLDEQNSISQDIEKRVDILFFGHMHKFEQSVTINFSEDITLRLQAGTLDTRNESSGYSIVKLHSKNKLEFGNVKYRKYSKEENKYLAWNKRVESGQHDYSIDKALLFDSQKFSDISFELREKIELEHIINTGVPLSEKKRLSDIYIKPKLSKQLEAGGGSAQESEITDFDELLHFKNIIVISGMEQDGKTTLLKYIQSEFLNRQFNKDLCQVVFYLDLKSLLMNSTSMMLYNLISDYLNHDLHTSFESKVKGAIHGGNAKILLDNFEKASQKTQACVLEFIEKYSDNSYLIICDNYSQPMVIAKFKQDPRYDVYSGSISEIARGDIRKIISLRPQLSLIQTEDEIFNNIIGLINNSQLPHNHFVYSILLVIYESEKDLNSILSESDIIENYIEILLHKHCMEVPENKPQYKVLIQFLGYLATSMLREQDSILTEKGKYSVVDGFEKRTFNDFRIDDYFEPAINSGILKKDHEGALEFSNSCFFYYFISCHMDSDPVLKGKVFSGENHLYLEKVVEYYSSKNSASVEVLNFMQDKLLIQKIKLSERISTEQGIEIDSLNLNSLDNISILDLASTNKDKFEEKITDLQVDREAYDEQQDSLVPLKNQRVSNTKVKSLDQEIEHDDSEFDIALRYKKELSLFSKVFRNTELLMDPEKVLDVFDCLVKSYVFLMKVNISRLDEDIILPLISTKVNEEYFSEDISEIKREKIITGFKLMLSVFRSAMPNQIEMMMSESMASKKPRFKNILKMKIDGTSDEMEELLLRFMLLEVDRSSLQENIKALLGKKGKLTNNALFFKSIQLLYMKHDLSNHDKAFLQNSAGRLVQKNDISVSLLKKLD